MDLLIKGKNIPKYCSQCICFHSELNVCKIDYCRTITTSNVFINRPDSCPLREIPTPHGDLIDKDVLLKEYESNPEDDQKMKNISLKCYNLMTDIVGVVTENINAMPTIIEAEE